MGYGGEVETIETFDEVVELARLRAPLYIRYSAGPGEDAEHASVDVEADVALPGLPATSLTPEPWWTRPEEDWVARRLCTALEFIEPDRADPDGGSAERRLWLLSGVVVGSGPHHEPLIGAPEPVGWVGQGAVDAAKELYRTRFHGAGMTPA